MQNKGTCMVPSLYKCVFRTYTLVCSGCICVSPASTHVSFRAYTSVCVCVHWRSFLLSVHTCLVYMHVFAVYPDVCFARMHMLSGHVQECGNMLLEPRHPPCQPRALPGSRTACVQALLCPNRGLWCCDGKRRAAQEKNYFCVCVNSVYIHSTRKQECSETMCLSECTGMFRPYTRVSLAPSERQPLA